MSLGNNELNNLATRVTICKSLMEKEQGSAGYLDKLVDAKDHVDRTEVEKHLDDFSCKEELERYVEQKDQDGK